MSRNDGGLATLGRSYHGRQTGLGVAKLKRLHVMPLGVTTGGHFKANLV